MTAPAARPRVIAHRGASGHVTENTMEAFDLALTLGADGIECDIRPCATGELVVFHDDTLERLAGRKDAVIDLTLAELRGVALPGGRRIPLLAEVLERFGAQTELHLEIKAQGVAAALAALLRRGGWNRARVISFFHHELRALRALAPEIPVAPVFAANPLDRAAQAEALGAVAIHPCLHYLDAPLVADARARGLEVATWTADAPRDIAHALALGVDAICGNYPDRIRALLERRPQ